MVVGTEALGVSLGEAATGSDLGGSSKYSNIYIYMYTRVDKSFLESTDISHPIAIFLILY